MSRRWVVALVLVVALAALVVVVAGRAGASARTAPPVAAPPASPRGLPAPAPLRTSPAGDELLARIRACSERDLDGIADRLSAGEALSLYRQLTPDDRRAALASLPVPLLARKAHELLAIPEARIRQAERPGLLVSALLEAAMAGTSDPGGALPRPLRFATAVDAGHVPQDARDGFRSDERRIYACLDAGLAPLGESGVLVRWTAEGSGAPVLVRYLPLAPDRRWNYVFFEPPVAWTAGTYRVQVYRIAEPVVLLASGSFLIRRSG